MELNDYQKRAMKTCMESSNNFAYMMLNLVGEVGEFASKVAKAIRKEQRSIGFDCRADANQLEEGAIVGVEFEDIATDDEEYEELYNQWNNNFNEELKKEAGDILWQLSGLCKVMGWTLEDVAQMNLDKLASRKQRGVIDGNGDNR